MVKILTHYTSNWLSIANIVVPILQEYSARHGYELHVLEVNPYEKYDGLVKLRMIMDRLDQYDVALVLDADAVLTNLNTKVESFLEDGKDLYLSSGLNMGAFIVRKTDWSTGFLLRAIKEIESSKFYCEQDFIINEFVEDFAFEKIKVCDHPCFNSYLSELYPHVKHPVTREQGQWEEGDFICHFPALSIEKRVEEMRKLKITR